jgi:hypothetical protein
LSLSMRAKSSARSEPSVKAYGTRIRVTVVMTQGCDCNSTATVPERGVGRRAAVAGGSANFWRSRADFSPRPGISADAGIAPRRRRWCGRPKAAVPVLAVPIASRCRRFDRAP